MASGRTHLSIGDVLALVQSEFPDITISKIRFLESQGLLDPERTPSGYRKFYERDIERLRWILIQQRDHFLPLKVIRERLQEWDDTGEQPSLGSSGHPAGHAARREAARTAVDEIAEGVAGQVADAVRDDLHPDDTTPRADDAEEHSGDLDDEPDGDDQGDPAATADPDPDAADDAKPADVDGADDDPAQGAADSSADEPADAGFDPRRAATELAAGTAIEVAPEDREPEPTAQSEPAGQSEPATPSEPAAASAGADDAAGRGDAVAAASGAGESTAAEREAWFGHPPDDATMTAEELALRTGVAVSVVADLEGYSLITSSRVGPDAYYDVDALRIVHAAKAFLDHGIEVRHLRMYKIAAEREAGVFEQLVMPLLKQRNPDARQRAEDVVGELATVGEQLHAHLLRAALRETFG